LAKVAAIAPHLALFVRFAAVWNRERVDSSFMQFANCSLPTGEAGTRERIDAGISVGRGEIIDDLSDVRIVDRRAVDLDHLGHFGLPKNPS